MSARLCVRCVLGAVVGVRSRRRSCERRSSAFSFPLDRVPSNSLATRKNIMARLLILVTALLASAVSAFSCSQPALVATQRPAASSVVVGDVRVSPEAIVMAVPKKRQSKMKTRQRKANWFAKADLQRERALTLGRSVLSGSASSFIYNPEADDDDDDDEEDDEEDDEDEEEEEEA